MLLAAWDSADLDQILDATERANAVLPASTLEVERIEMIREAGSVLRVDRAGHVEHELVELLGDVEHVHVARFLDARQRAPTPLHIQPGFGSDWTVRSLSRPRATLIGQV